MKMITITLAVSTFLGIPARGQGFLNLNFESAQNLPGSPGNGVLVPETNALPDWNAFDGSMALSKIYYVSNTLGNVSGSVELEGGSLALSGNFSVGLYDGGAISQTGLVPDNAESLDFEGKGLGPNGSIQSSDLEVILGGQTLSYSAVSEGAGYFIYGANIPLSMDGQVEALMFSCQGVGSGNVVLDDIQFSTSPAPEPGELALMGTAVILIWLWRRGKR